MSTIIPILFIGTSIRNNLRKTFDLGRLCDKICGVGLGDPIKNPRLSAGVISCVPVSYASHLVSPFIATGGHDLAEVAGAADDVRLDL